MPSPSWAVYALLDEANEEGAGIGQAHASGFSGASGIQPLPLDFGLPSQTVPSAAAGSAVPSYAATSLAVPFPLRSISARVAADFPLSDMLYPGPSDNRSQGTTLPCSNNVFDHDTYLRASQTTATAGNQSPVISTRIGRDSGYESGENMSKLVKSSSTHAPALQHEEAADARGLHCDRWTASQTVEDQLFPSEINNADIQPPPAFPLSAHEGDYTIMFPSSDMPSEDHANAWADVFLAEGNENLPPKQASADEN